jgi:hypothetical protein
MYVQAGSTGDAWQETNTGIGVESVHVAVVHSYREVRVKEAHQEAALANLAPNLGKEVP